MHADNTENDKNKITVPIVCSFTLGEPVVPLLIAVIYKSNNSEILQNQSFRNSTNKIELATTDIR